MASENNNPFKRFKKALKGKKADGLMAHEMARKAVKHTGSFGGKSNKLGQGGRAAQLKAQGVPGGVIGNLARAAHAAPGQANYHKSKRKTKKKEGGPAPIPQPSLGMAMKKKHKKARKGGEPTIGFKDEEDKKKRKEAVKGEPTLGDKDIEHKKKRKGSVGMEGDKEEKGAIHCKVCKAYHAKHSSHKNKQAPHLKQTPRVKKA